MTTSISRAQGITALDPAARVQEQTALQPVAETQESLPSRFVLLMLCMALVLSTLAFGTVHTWALAIFETGAGVTLILWAADAWRTSELRISRNFLQVPLLAFCLLALFQMLPITGNNGNVANGFAGLRSLSLDPYATSLALIKSVSLLVYFCAALVFINTPRRLRLVVRTVIIFGFFLALLGPVQHFTSPRVIYWFRDVSREAVPFGPFINGHHFAGYMELVLGLPLGLLLSGAVDRDQRVLYGFAVAMMAIALIITNSRGGMISFAAEVLFLFAISSAAGKGGTEPAEDASSDRVKIAVKRVVLGGVIVVAVFASVLLFGGEAALSRLLGTVNSDDPTTGRLHFWQGAIQIIKDHPVLGVGLGAFGVAYTRYDTANGLFRVEQAHNDYLQLLTDGGVVAAFLGLLFLVWLFRMGISRAGSKDLYRRGVANGALCGCFGVLIHSFFDFTLHTTSNALLFLTMAALATINGRVEKPARRSRRRRRRKSHHIAEAQNEAGEASQVVG